MRDTTHKVPLEEQLVVASNNLLTVFYARYAKLTWPSILDESVAYASDQLLKNQLRYDFNDVHQVYRYLYITANRKRVRLCKKYQRLNRVPVMPEIETKERSTMAFEARQFIGAVLDDLSPVEARILLAVMQEESWSTLSEETGRSVDALRKCWWRLRQRLILQYGDL